MLAKYRKHCFFLTKIPQQRKSIPRDLWTDEYTKKKIENRKFVSFDLEKQK